MDNVPELVARLVGELGRANDIEFKYIQLGKPMQNGYIERFNKSYREGVLDAYVFRNLDGRGKGADGQLDTRLQPLPPARCTWRHSPGYVQKPIPNTFL